MKERAGPRETPFRSALPLVLFDLAIAGATAILFWPLTRYFLAQDDFPLIERARQGVAAALDGSFERGLGQFRPLTKGLYFVLAESVFGLNAAAYHVTSILLHVLDAVLFGVLLRRMGVSAVGSRLVVALFALNVAFFEAIAWASCVQQLIGALFLLAALIFGIDALDGRRERRLPSTLALVLALSSYEQTLAAPVVLLLWQATRRGARSALASTREWLWIQFVLLGAYAVFMVGWRLPDTGPYVMTAGQNVPVNLMIYTSLLFSPWAVFPDIRLPSTLAASHVVALMVVGYLLLRRRFGTVTFALTSFALLLAPVTFLTNHVHSFHVYVPCIMTWYLLAVAVDDLLLLLAARRRLRAGLVAAAVVLCFAGSTVALRRNTAATVRDDIPLKRSFVLRRAVMAQAMWDCMRTKAHPPFSRLVLVYAGPRGRFYWSNMRTALGGGSAVRLAFDRPWLEVVFVPPSDPPDLDQTTEVLLYTVEGRCMTMAEAERRQLDQGSTTPEDESGTNGTDEQ